MCGGALPGLGIDLPPDWPHSCSCGACVWGDGGEVPLARSGFLDRDRDREASVQHARRPEWGLNHKGGEGGRAFCANLGVMVEAEPGRVANRSLLV